jgi:hypothetical protein
MERVSLPDRDEAVQDGLAAYGEVQAVQVRTRSAHGRSSVILKNGTQIDVRGLSDDRAVDSSVVWDGRFYERRLNRSLAKAARLITRLTQESTTSS